MATRVSMTGALVAAPLVKDSQRFAQTGGWGFQRFVGDSKTERAAAPTSEQCFAWHNRLKQDGLILSSDRP